MNSYHLEYIRIIKKVEWKTMLIVNIHSQLLHQRMLVGRLRWTSCLGQGVTGPPLIGREMWQAPTVPT